MGGILASKIRIGTLPYTQDREPTLFLTQQRQLEIDRVPQVHGCKKKLTVTRDDNRHRWRGEDGDCMLFNRTKWYK